MKITLPFDPEWRALAWARENCPGYITNQAAKDQPQLVPVKGGWVAERPYIEYYFSNERDATAFALKWA